MVEETQFDEVVTCDHSYDKRCHTSYVTSFLSQQEEECEENFRKVSVFPFHQQNAAKKLCNSILQHMILIRLVLTEY